MLTVFVCWSLYLGEGQVSSWCSVGEDSVNYTLRCTFLYVNEASVIEFIKKNL